LYFTDICICVIGMLVKNVYLCIYVFRNNMKWKIGTKR